MIQGQGSRKLHNISQTDDTTGTALVAAATQYLTATVQAVKAGVDDADPTANTGTVRLNSSANGVSLALTPGQTMVLPDFCDLADFELWADTTADGVVILYTTET